MSSTTTTTSSLRTRASIVAALATVSVLAAAVWWRRVVVVQPHEPPRHDDDDDDEYPPPGVSPAVLYAFEECAERIRTVVPHLADGDKLFLYALYKQATAGNAPRLPPTTRSSSSSWNIVAAQAKYAAWRKLQGMPRQGAFFQYIATAQVHIDEHLADQTTELVDNRTSGKGENDVHDDSMGPSSLTVAVSRPVMLTTDSDDDDTTDNGQDEYNSMEGLFLRSAAANDVDVVRRLVQDHFPAALDINHQDRMGQSALHLAADHGALDVMEYLLSTHGHDIDVDATDDDGISVLQAAVIAGQVPACRLLLNHGANPDLADHDGDTPRHCAADDGSMEMKTLFDSTPVHKTSSRSRNVANGHS